MSTKHDIITYSKLADGANFYLNEAFHYIDEALCSEFALLLFSKELESIDPSKNDRIIAKNLNLPENPIELLQATFPDPLTKNTLKSMNDTWNKAQILSKCNSYKFGLKHTINSIEMLGHLNNFGFFIETLVNRHLLFLKEVNLMDDFSYSRISIAKVMERLIFIFKEDLKANKIQLSEISNLFSLRNKTVHYTPDNAIALKPEISKIFQIWAQAKKMIERFENIEQFNEDRFSFLLDNHFKEIKNKWT